MENILAIAIFALGISITFLFARHLIKSHAASVEAEKKQQELMDKINVAATRDRERALTKVVQKPLHEESESDLDYMRQHNLITASQEKEALRKKRTFVKRNESTVPPRGKETTVTYAPSPTQSVQSSSFLSDAADIAMIASTIHHWNDNTPTSRKSVDIPTEDRSVGVTTKESSWGFDDSDSRKSISSSMDTSPSYSSSSSSSSSDSWSSSSDSSSSVSSDW